MSDSIRRIPTVAFREKCVAFLRQVAATGRPLLVTKWGKPVARVVPVDRHGAGSLIASIVRAGDLISPIGVTWDAERPPTAPRPRPSAPPRRGCRPTRRRP